MKNYTKLAVAITALVTSISANAAGTIDLFIDPVGETLVEVQTSSGIGATDYTENNMAYGSILGGYRAMEVELASSTGSPSSGVSMSVFNGTLSFNNDNNVTGKGTLQWDGNDASIARSITHMDENLLLLGEAFQFDVLSADLGFNFSIALYDTLGGSVLFDLASNAGPHTTNIAFSLFTNAFSNGLCAAADPFFPVASSGGTINNVDCTGTSLDLEHIGALEIVLNTGAGTTSVDLSIGAITAVPEPSSIALLGLGLIGSAFASRKKQS